MLLIFTKGVDSAVLDDKEINTFVTVVYRYIPLGCSPADGSKSPSFFIGMERPTQRRLKERRHPPVFFLHDRRLTYFQLFRTSIVVSLLEAKRCIRAPRCIWNQELIRDQFVRRCGYHMRPAHIYHSVD